MSKIDELIKQLCPDGVEFKQLGQIGFFYGGLSGKTKNDFQNGNAKFISYMNVYSNIAVNTNVKDLVRVGENENQNQIELGDVLFTGSSETPDECGMSSVLTNESSEPLYLNSFCFGFRLNNTEIFLPHFLKYLFRSDEIRKQIGQTASGVTRFNISKKRFEKIKIPIPPLAIQEEIVNILDAFTTLEAELEAELEARKKQYTFYRDSLLSFEGNDVEWKTLGEVGEIRRGVAFTKKQSVSGKYPVVANAPIPICYHNEANRIGECVVIARSGANAGLVSYWNEEMFLTDAFSIHPNHSLVNTKFIYYYLKNKQDEIHLMKKGGGVPHVRASDFEIYSVPILPMKEQNRIVSILDKFDALVNDISIGLPAEIEARKKQYEYYRNQLLTFAPIQN